MRSPVQASILCTLCLSLFGIGSAGRAPRAKVPFSTVAPLIKAKCSGCHNAASHPEGVDLSSYAALMKSGKHGSIVVPGHPEKSKIIMYVDGEKQPRMPFKKQPLSAAEIKQLKSWVAAGAKG